MILCELYHAETGQIERIDPDQVCARLAESNSFVWVDIERPTDEEFAWLHTTFQFHPLAMEDAHNQRQRAKIDRYDDYYFFVMRAIFYHQRSHRVDYTQLNLFCGRNYLVTIHSEHIPALDQARQRWERYPLPKEAISYLFYLVSDVVVDSYFPVIDKMGDEIDRLDEEIFTSPQQHVLKETFALRKGLLGIRKSLVPLRDAFNELIRIEEAGAIFTIRETRVFFSDVYDHLLRLIDFVDTYRDMLSGTLDAYQSSQSNRLNENMQRLTVVTTILATSTVITGFYGMNLHGMMINSPWAYGGWVMFGVLTVVTAFEIWIFHRMGWI